MIQVSERNEERARHRCYPATEIIYFYIEKERNVILTICQNSILMIITKII